MRRALDFSNFDSDVPFDEAAVAAFRAAGADYFILGTQNPAIARAQAAVALAGGMTAVAVYVEPGKAADAAQATIDGIAIAHELGVSTVYAGCEAGGVNGIPELRGIRQQVEAAGLRVGVYAGSPTWAALFDSSTEFSDCPLWFPGYWGDRRIIDTVAFGGWTKVAIHQYASSPAIAGRDRDYDMILEDDMDPAQVEALVESLFLPLLEQALGSKESTFVDTAAIARIRALLNTPAPAGVPQHTHPATTTTTIGGPS